MYVIILVIQKEEYCDQNREPVLADSLDVKVLT